MLSRELKIGIIGGVISSVLVIIFIQPILSFVWSAVISFGESVQADYVDRIYRNAAVGERNLIGHLSLLALLMLLSYLPTAFFVREISRRHDIYNKARAFYFAIALMAIFASFVLLIAFSISSGVMEINASFNQRLSVIAPAISDQEYKEWKARWAKMHSQSDYRALVAAMEKRASDLQIQLPELRKP